MHDLYERLLNISKLGHQKSWNDHFLQKMMKKTLRKSPYWEKVYQMTYLKIKIQSENKLKYEMISLLSSEKWKKIWPSVDEYIFLYQLQKLGLYDQKVIL